MAVSYIDKLQAQAFKAGIEKNTEKSLQWFKRELQGMKTINRQNLLRDDNLKPRTRALPGRMFMYFYDPKHKKTLPYYDRFPLVIPVDEAEGGFVGLNMHYLPLRQRAVLMDALYKTVSDQRYNEKTKMRINYNVLKNASRFKSFKPTFKKYLASNVRTRFVKIEPVEWDIALFLPLQRFEKASAARIHRDSLGALQ